jgi:hypothetical protein
MMKLLSLRRRHCRVLLALFLISSLAAGCGKPKGSVSGKVSYKGKPMTAGSVTFTPVDGPAVSGPIDTEGNYRVEKVQVGMNKISVLPGGGMNSDGIAKVSDPRNPKQMMEAFKSKTPTLKLPKKYNNPEDSELSCDVKIGIQEHNIELK